MKEERPVRWTERMVVTGVLAFALAAIVCGIALYPLYRELIALRAENARLKEEAAGCPDHKRLKEELANAEYVIATMLKRHPGYGPKSGVGMSGTIPDVRTKVVDVRPKSGHVALGAGKSSGIREGFVFLIHRGDEYLGKVRVTTVWEEFSGGTMIERKRPIKAGDDAMTDTAPGP